MLVLGTPTEGDKPDPSTFRAFRLNAGDGAIIHLGPLTHTGPLVVLLAPTSRVCTVRAGTWHDFPKAITSPVVVITMNSEEVVDALAKAGCARPMGTCNPFAVVKWARFAIAAGAAMAVFPHTFELNTICNLS